MSLTNEQYLALSKLAYVDFKNGDISQPISECGDSIRKKFTDYATNPIIQNILPTMSNWRLIAHQSNTHSGFAGSAFESPDGKIVFAFRGTEPPKDISVDAFYAFMQDAYTDGIMLFSVHLNPQFSDAIDFVEQIIKQKSGLSDKKDIIHYMKQNGTSFTGHSLGGALAQYANVSFVDEEKAPHGIKAVSFNAPGIGHKLFGENFVGLDNYDVINIMNLHDLVSHLGSHLGVSHYLVNDKTNYTHVDINALRQLNENRVKYHLGEIDYLQYNIKHNELISQIKSKENGELILEQTTKAMKGTLPKAGNHDLESLIAFKNGGVQIVARNTAVDNNIKIINEIVKLNYDIYVVSHARANNYLDRALAGERYDLDIAAGNNTINWFQPVSVKTSYTNLQRFSRNNFTISIGTIKADYQRTVANAQRRVDPLVIDLDGDGIETINSNNSSAHFDLDSNGFAEKNWLDW